MRAMARVKLIMDFKSIDAQLDKIIMVPDKCKNKCWKKMLKKV